MGIFWAGLNWGDTVMNENDVLGISLVVQWLRLCASNAGDVGSIPAGGTKIPYATGHDQN